MKKIIVSFLAILLLTGSLLLCACHHKKNISTDPPGIGSESENSVVSFVPPSDRPDVPSDGSSGNRPPLSNSTPSDNQSSLDNPTPPNPPTSPDPPDTPSDDPSPEDPVIELSGTCSSNTGTQLNLVVDWKIETVSPGNYKVTVTVYLDSYSLYCSARTNCNSITVGDYDFVYSTDAIAYDDGTGKHHTQLALKEVLYTAETLPEQLEIGADWYFNGTYSRTPIGMLSASTTVKTGI